MYTLSYEEIVRLLTGKAVHLPDGTALGSSLPVLPTPIGHWALVMLVGLGALQEQEQRERNQE